MDDGGAARRRLQERHLLLQEEHEIRADGDERRGDGIHEHRARGDVSSAFNDDLDVFPPSGTRRGAARARVPLPVPERLLQSSELTVHLFRTNADTSTRKVVVVSFISSNRTGTAADAMPRFVQGVAVGATPSISADASHRGWRLPAGKRKLAGALLAAFVFLALRDAMDGTRALEHADVDPPATPPAGPTTHFAITRRPATRASRPGSTRTTNSRRPSRLWMSTSDFGAHRRDRSGFPTS